MIRSGVMPSSSRRLRQPSWYAPREAPPARMNATFFSLSAIERPQPTHRVHRARRRAQPGGQHLPLAGLRPAGAGEPARLAPQVPVDGRLDRVLVRRGLEAELALGLRVPVGPPAGREPDLVGADRRAAAG